MKTVIDSQLSSEFQELFLENKEWLADVLFLEDEIRFITKLMKGKFQEAVRTHHLTEMHQLMAKLQKLETQCSELKAMVDTNRHSLETCISDPESPPGLDLIENCARIQQEIKTLFKADASLKRELFALVVKLMEQEKDELPLTGI